MIVKFTDAPPDARRFLDYLEERTGAGPLRLAKDFCPIHDGWETYVFLFELAGEHDLAPCYRGPLVLRMYSCVRGLERLRHEFQAQRHLLDLGYPVARPLVLEENDRLFGGPFMIMRQVRGRTILDTMLRCPWRIIDGPGWMAEAHAQLHRLASDRLPARGGSFLRRQLDDMRAAVWTYGLSGLKSGLAWLEDHQPAACEQSRIIHLDFHPGNLMFAGRCCTGVLDWTEWDVGDRHADVASTLVLIRSAPVITHTTWQRLALWPGRGMLYRRYLRAYRRLLPVDRSRLRYFLAWASLRRLCRFGMWLRAGPWITGGKPSSLRYLGRARIRVLASIFENQSSVPVTLP
jgi:aminoglycoside phosphotransferase (APT) family kinase protein